MKGSDSIEDMELKLLRMQENMNDLDGDLNAIRFRIMEDVEKEYLKAKLAGNDAVVAKLRNQDLRDAEVKRRLSENEEFMTGIIKSNDMELTLKIGRIRVDQMKRAFQISLPALQHSTKIRAEKTMKVDEDGNVRGDLETGAHLMSLAGSIDEIIAVLEQKRREQCGDDDDDVGVGVCADCDVERCPVRKTPLAPEEGVTEVKKASDVQYV